MREHVMSRQKVLAASLAALALVGTATSALAERNRYTGLRPGQHYGYHHHRGIGAGGIAAGAALGIAGAAIAGAAANRYYNGYPAYNYGPGYGPRYGYDYIPDRGYYGPY